MSSHTKADSIPPLRLSKAKLSIIQVKLARRRQNRQWLEENRARLFRFSQARGNNYVVAVGTADDQVHFFPVLDSVNQFIKEKEKDETIRGTLVYKCRRSSEMIKIL